MVASSVTIIPKYLDGRNETVLSGGVSTLEDDTSVIKSENRTVSTFERSDRVLRSWQLSWNNNSNLITQLFHVCRNSKGFLFISPIADERVCTGQLLRNTVTGLNVGDGSTKTFQLQAAVSISYDIGGGTASSDTVDVNYPLSGSVVGYKDGVAAALDDVNLLTGVITFSTAPGAGAVPTADFQRAFAAMFTSKSIGRTLFGNQRTELRSVQIDEIL